MSDQLTNDLQSLRIDRGDADSTARDRHASTPSAIPRVIMGLALVGGVAYGGVWAWPRVSAQVFKTEVHSAEIIVVSPAQAATAVTATGYVIALTSARVSARTPGRIAVVHVHEGDTVHTGQAMIELDATDVRSAVAAAHARVAAAEARVAVARATLDDVRQQLERQRVLERSGSAPRQAVEDLVARLRPLEASVAAAAAEVHSLQAEVGVQTAALSLLTIRAPFDGTVTNRPPRPGELLGGDPTSPAINVADFHSLVAEVDVPEGRLGLVHTDGPCEVSLDAFPGRRFRGVVQEVGHQVDRSKASVPVRVHFVDAIDGVLPDMAARVGFLTQALSPEMLRAAQKTLVPAAAITTRGGNRVVFVIDNGSVHVHSVRLGAPSGDAFELLDGPAPGSRVVLHPPVTLGDTSPVREATP